MEWIKVEDGMPRIGSEVLVYPATWKYDVLIDQVRVYNNGRWEPQFEDGSLKGITHWMSLPDSPILSPDEQLK